MKIAVFLRSVIAGAALFVSFSAYSQPNGEIAPYVGFLKKQDVPAKEYILSLFEKKDIVILCERDHREMTQYDLILDVMRDPRFVRRVGAVYTELGDSGMDGRINTFLKTGGLSPEEIRAGAIQIQRDAMSPLWEKSDYFCFIEGVYGINSGLPAGKKLTVHPLDILGVARDSAALRGQYMKMAGRDSLMAAGFAGRYGANGKGKVLIIMNSRHAFKHDMVSADGHDIRNFGRFITEKYPGRVASVMINNWSEGNSGAFFGLVRDGRWDAAFRYLGIRDAGFDMAGSPFGGDRLDYSNWMLANNTYSYADMFDGFVFYRPVEEFRIGIGIDGFMEDGFYEEYLARARLFNRTFGVEAYPLDESVMIFNKMQISPMNDLDAMNAKIGRWLE